MRHILLGSFLVIATTSVFSADLTGRWEMLAELPSATREYRLNVGRDGDAGRGVKKERRAQAAHAPLRSPHLFIILE
jgi:hypothetical protein